MSTIQAPDFEAIKARQQATWASGDFSVVASRIVYQAEHLCETADLQSGRRVLDVALRAGGRPQGPIYRSVGATREGPVLQSSKQRPVRPFD